VVDVVDPAGCGRGAVEVMPETGVAGGMDVDVGPCANEADAAEREIAADRTADATIY
jgi:hypothetical protein